MKRLNPTEDYEFRVSKEEGYDDEEAGKFGYSVSLPHQCSEWEIVGWDEKSGEDFEEVKHVHNYPAYPVSKEFAVERMELFIKRAQQALEQLKQLS